jgi:small subunit ribosomal protein S8
VDPIADFLTIVRNGYLAKKKEVSVRFSKAREGLSKILTEHGYLASVEKKDNFLILHLQYEGIKPALLGLKRISKPGLRIYRGKRKIPKTPFFGLTIVSTSKGLMTDREAKKGGLGGEIVCQVW